MTVNLQNLMVWQLAEDIPGATALFYQPNAGFEALREDPMKPISSKNNVLFHRLYDELSGGRHD